MRNSMVKWGLIILTLFAVVLLVVIIQNNQNDNEEVTVPFENLNDIVKIKVYHMVDGEYEHEHVDENEIQQIVEFFKDRKCTSGEKTDKTGSIATIVFIDSDGTEQMVTIINSSLFGISSTDDEVLLYESDHIGEDFQEFYPNFLKK